jgi:hypothetical protein
VRRSYDRIAARYAGHFSDELAHKPFDRRFLDRLAAAREISARRDSECRAWRNETPTRVEADTRRAYVVAGRE